MEDDQNNTVKIGSIAAEEFNQKLESGDYILLDIRTEGEYRQGRIADVQNIDIASRDFEKKLNELNKDKKYLIYCFSGSRTQMALRIMQSLGFVEVYDLSGGIQVWSMSGFNTIS
jgi:rhodanese-related sulfurtransferase